MTTAAAPRAFALHLKPYQEALLAVVLGSLVGLASNLVSPAAVIALLIVAIMAQWVIKRPEFMLLGMLFVYSGIVGTDFLPLIPIGIGSLNPMDLLLGGFTLVILLRRIIEPGFRLHVTLPAAGVLIFFVLAVVATIVGFMNGTTVIDRATTELRYIGYYLSFLVAAYLLDPKQIRTLVIGFFALAVFVSAAQILQAAVGPDVPVIYGRTEGFEQDGVKAEDVTRVIPPGRYVVFVAFITAPLLIIFARKRSTALLYGVMWLFFTVGIILTFNRNMWVSGAVVYALYLLVLDQERRKQAFRLFGGSLATLALMIAMVLLLAPGTTAAEVLQSTIVRFVSIFDDSTYTAEYSQTNTVASLEFRKIENKYALPHLIPPQLVGLGMGAYYRPVLLNILDYEGGEMPEYIHNGHFWLLMKVGLIGYLGLMSAFLYMIARGWQWRRAIPEYQPLVLGFSFSLIAILLSTIVDPILVDLTWTPVCGVMFGIIQVSFQSSTQTAAIAPTVIAASVTTAAS